MRLAFIIALIYCSAMGQAFTFNDAPFIANANAFVDPGGAPATYLIKQDFEGAGYDNSETWTEAGTGTLNEDDTTSPSPLVGSQSLRVVFAAETGTTTSPVFAAQADCWLYARIHPVAIVTVGSTVSLTIRHAAGECLRLRIMNTGLVGVRAGGGTEAVTVDAMSNGTEYHIWCHYIKGTGANAVATVGFSTDGTKPTSGNKFASSVNGTATADADRVQIGSGVSTTHTYVWDKIRIDDVSIGNNPL